MKRHATSERHLPTKKQKLKQKAKVAVLFGFKLADEDEVGYFGKDLNIVKERADAKEFSLKRKKASKSVLPQKWCQLINEDESLNHGYKFHVIKCFSLKN